MTAGDRGEGVVRLYGETRAPHRGVWRAAVWFAALAVFASASTFTVGRVEGSSAGAAASVGGAHRTPVVVGHEHGAEKLQVRSLHPRPAFRARTLLAVLAVGIVVAALARWKLLLSVRTVARAFRRTSLHSSRGPPLARIA